MPSRPKDAAGRTPGDAGGHVSEPVEQEPDQQDGDGTWTTEPFPGVTTGKPVRR